MSQATEACQGAQSPEPCIWMGRCAGYIYSSVVLSVHPPSTVHFLCGFPNSSTLHLSLKIPASNPATTTNGCKVDGGRQRGDPHRVPQLPTCAWRLEATFTAAATNCHRMLASAASFSVMTRTHAPQATDGPLGHSVGPEVHGPSEVDHRRYRVCDHLTCPRTNGPH